MITTFRISNVYRLIFIFAVSPEGEELPEKPKKEAASTKRNE